MKEFLEWRKEWSLGVEIIDSQHRQLATILNEIAELSLNVDESIALEIHSNKLHELLSLLHKKISEHFNDEEGLMIESDYPCRTEHIREHSMLRAELKQYIRDIEEGEDRINMETLGALKIWFIAHIMSSDKEFANFL